jgi:hypothetical protein
MNGNTQEIARWRIKNGHVSTRRLLAMFAKGRYLHAARPRSADSREDLEVLTEAGYIEIDQERKLIVVTDAGRKFVDDTGPYYGL